MIWCGFVTSRYLGARTQLLRARAEYDCVPRYAWTAASKLLTSLKLGLERDPQMPYDLNMHQMEQIQRDFLALLGLSISLCFLVSSSALQLTSLFCRKRAEYCWLPGPYFTQGFSCTCAVLSTPTVWSICISCVLREATGLIESLAWRQFLCFFAAWCCWACRDTVVAGRLSCTYLYSGNDMRLWLVASSWILDMEREQHCSQGESGIHPS